MNATTGNPSRNAEIGAMEDAGVELAANTGTQRSPRLNMVDVALRDAAYAG